MPRVGVVAATNNIAQSLIRELGIRDAYPFSANHVAIQCRGQALAALVVDEDVWPLSKDAMASLRPALVHSGGYILRLSRHDPLK